MQGRSARTLTVLDWGCLEYADALKRQQELVESRIADRIPDHLILVEHPPVVTVGRSGGQGDLLTSPESLARSGIQLHYVDRGGQATYHGPGQMVAWPIVKLARKELHDHLDRLLTAAQDMLRSYDLPAVRKKGRPGLWVDGAKIASIGLAVRKWVTYHGLALNVNSDLSGFRHLIPCGRPEEKITSMTRALGEPVRQDEVKERFIRAFTELYRERGMPAADMETKTKHPAWLVRPAPDESAINQMEGRLEQLNLATVCQSAHCPNLGECFKKGTATFMILGRNCTRGCRFCAVDRNRPDPVDPEEPGRVAQAVRSLGLNYAVITSVTRDDLPDGGAGHFVGTIRQIRDLCPGVRVEVLTPDFKGRVGDLDRVLAARPDVFNHNLETVSRLYPDVRPQARYRRSLGVLRRAADFGLTVKSGLMLGLGETAAEIKTTITDIKRSGCHYLTLGQYLAPSPDHAPVRRYVPPEEFEFWADQAREVGLIGVAAGPLVRSSYRAEKMFRDNGLSGEIQWPGRNELQAGEGTSFRVLFGG